VQVVSVGPSGCVTTNAVVVNMSRCGSPITFDHG
jgi:hypothetical protein